MHDCQNSFFDMKVSDIYNDTPKIIQGDSPMTQAEEIIKKNRIHSLIVSDKESKLVGIIDAISCIVNL